MKNTLKFRAIFFFVLMISITAGIAAANYPAPFVVKSNLGPKCDISLHGCSVNGGKFGYDDKGNCYCDMSNVLIIKSNLQTNLQSFMSAGVSGPTTSTSGEIVNLINKKPEKPEKSKEERECIKKGKGCFLDKVCYYIGWRINKSYCKDKVPLPYAVTILRPQFVNQSKWELNVIMILNVYQILV